jgi:hypothetical protein
VFGLPFVVHSVEHSVYGVEVTDDLSVNQTKQQTTKRRRFEMDTLPISEWRYDPDYADKLFVHLHEDLRIRLEAAAQDREFAHYHLLNVARLVRQLLDDDDPLIELVNERHKVDLVFPVASIGSPKRSEVPVEYRDYLPNLSNNPPGYFVHVLTREEFLDGEIGNFGGQSIKRSDVIAVVANCLGGVHLNKKLQMKWRRTITVFNQWLTVGDLGSVIELARGIGNRTYLALWPLRKAVEKFHG